MPVVNVGTRQDMRERGSNVVDAPHEAKAIAAAIRRQVDHGRYAMQPIYGDGKAGERIAEVLARCQVSVQKPITY